MIDVVCAVIISDGKVLVTQRGFNKSNPNKWEFPGGKVEQHETKKECLIREIKEELNIAIRPVFQMKSIIHHYQNISVNLTPYIAEKINGEIILKDHQTYNLFSLDDLIFLDWLEADTEIVKQLNKIRNDFDI